MGATPGAPDAGGGESSTPSSPASEPSTPQSVGDGILAGMGDDPAFDAPGVDSGAGEGADTDPATPAEGKAAPKPIQAKPIQTDGPGAEPDPLADGVPPTSPVLTPDPDAIAAAEAVKVAGEAGGGAGGEAGGEPGGKTGGYLFAGQRFENQEAAENVFRSAQGRSKTASQNISAVKGENSSLRLLVAQWQQAAGINPDGTPIASDPNKPGTGAPAADPNAAAASPEAELGLNPKVAKLLVDDGGLPALLKYMDDVNTKRLEAHSESLLGSIREEFKDKLRGLDSFKQDSENVVRAKSLFNRAAVALDENTGVKRFPLLEEHAEEVGKIWTQLGPLAYAEDLSGFETAYSLFLYRHGLSGGSATAPEVPGANPTTPGNGAGGSNVEELLQTVRGQGPNATIAGGSSGHDGNSPLAAQARFATTLVGTKPGEEESFVER